MNYKNPFWHLFWASILGSSAALCLIVLSHEYSDPRWYILLFLVTNTFGFLTEFKKWWRS